MNGLLGQALKNFLFSNGIDFIYQIFNIEKKTKNKQFTKILKVFGKMFFL